MFKYRRLCRLPVSTTNYVFYNLPKCRKCVKNKPVRSAAAAVHDVNTRGTRSLLSTVTTPVLPPHSTLGLGQHTRLPPHTVTRYHLKVKAQRAATQDRVKHVIFFITLPY